MILHTFISVFDAEQCKTQIVNELLSQSDKLINYKFINPRVFGYNFRSFDLVFIPTRELNN